MGGVFVLYLVGVVVGFIIYLGELVYNNVMLKGIDPNTGTNLPTNLPLSH